MKKTILHLSLFLFICSSYAQLIPERTLGAWYDIGGNHKVSEKTSIETYMQFWLYEVNDNFNFFLFKVGYNHHFTPKLTTTIYLGYSDFDGNINISSPHTYEKRITEQVVYKHKLIKIPLDHRFRIEHRFFRKHNSKPKVARLRYRLGSKITLNKSLFIRSHNELLLSPKSSSVPENRFYLGLGIKLSKSINLHLGYLNRHTTNKKNLHRLQTAVFFKTDLRKKSLK